MALHGHRLYVAGSLIFCCACARYSESKFRKLAQPCPAELPTFRLVPSSVRVLRRLWDGLHPVDSHELGNPQPLTRQVWLNLFGPADVAQPAERGTVRTYSEFAAGDRPCKVVIPANATVNGVPIRRLTAKTPDMYWTGASQLPPSRSGVVWLEGGSDGEDEESSSSGDVVGGC